MGVVLGVVCGRVGEKRVLMSFSNEMSVEFKSGGGCKGGWFCGGGFRADYEFVKRSVWEGKFSVQSEDGECVCVSLSLCMFVYVTNRLMSVVVKQSREHSLLV